MQNSFTQYICPMHPEVVSDRPGKCPKCGMALVSSEAKSSPHPTSHIEDRGLSFLTWRSYIPLIVILGLIIVSATVASLSSGTQFFIRDFILRFMTGFFLVFSGFKLMDLKGFAEGYSTYDLIAARFYAYGYAYPFIELAFGLMMLAGYHSSWLLWTELIVMIVSGLGVARKLMRHEELMCACLGTFLKVPLTKVTLIEDFGMGILALILILIT